MPANSAKLGSVSLGRLLEGVGGDGGTFVTLHDDPDAGPHAFVDEFCWVGQSGSKVRGDSMSMMFTYRAGEVEKP